VCHDSLQKHKFSKAKPSHTHFWEPPSFSRQLLLRVVNHTLLLIWTASRFSTKCQFSEVKPSLAHLWKPPSFSWQLLVHVENHTLLLIRTWHDSLRNISSVRQNLHRCTFENHRVFLGRELTRARSTPNTECVTILYKMSVRWDKTLIGAFENHRLFLGSYSCA